MSEEKSRENIAIVNEATGKLFTDSNCVPGDDEMPVDVMQALFGPIKKKEEKGEDEEGETAEEEPQSHLDEEVEELEKFLATLKEEKGE